MDVRTMFSDERELIKYEGYVLYNMEAMDAWIGHGCLTLSKLLNRKTEYSPAHI